MALFTRGQRLDHVAERRRGVFALAINGLTAPGHRRGSAQARPSSPQWRRTF